MIIDDQQIRCDNYVCLSEGGGLTMRGRSEGHHSSGLGGARAVASSNTITRGNTRRGYVILKHDISYVFLPCALAPQKLNN